VPHSDPAAEGARILTICNACRYCEGYCAVFPAMEHRHHFAPSDIHYLANLCHNCAECYYACQYAPPHEFAVNVPKVLAEARLQSYRQYAQPRPCARLFGKNLEWIFAVTVLSLAALWLFPRTEGSGEFYVVISHNAMVAVFGLVSALVAAALAAGLASFWRELGEGASGFGNSNALIRAGRSVASLEYLGSGGRGCTYPNERHSNARRWFHQLTLYGFLLCFASTTVAAYYHYALHRFAPHPYFSVPVVLGTLGGIGLLIGPAGLYALKRHRDDAIADPKQDGLDLTFIALLFWTSLSGLLLLAVRESRMMAPALAIHLAAVLVLFVTLPYGKFVHGIYRSAALLRYALEQDRGRQSHGAGEG
jgi:citrate/tricarballylate utilization protein